MFDAALIQQCADPGIEIGLVERFIAEAGSDNPLAVSITLGNRVILPEAPRSPGEALHLIQRFVGQATVRVGITQYPAGYGVSAPAEIAADVVDACTNIRMGTALFGKVYRIVAANGGSAGPAVFDEAIAAWSTGRYGQDYVFALPDPGPAQDEAVDQADNVSGGDDDLGEQRPMEIDQETAPTTDVPTDPNHAGIRIDLSTISQDSEHPK